ncbi:Similar to Increased rDNA silencing protein 4; acc. no. A1CBF3 [Pyronema omphalodes CBS 100304]|uniref:Similar to Increased rDNA silencing protein 4 acc. no. A1CBF3 n=1 Tax=Pyronema omphalodes (strain CBS 100304) TaxID=1076935 RepID=U4LAV5_PYROM|nr:Similar to Increased rDNA silencing protein 4; acc. no. A1CBF3 [Pyronema omphalodes CBS 100304]
MAASIVFARSSPTRSPQQEATQGPSVQLRRKLFQDPSDDPTEAPGGFVGGLVGGIVSDDADTNSTKITKSTKLPPPLPKAHAEDPPRKVSPPVDSSSIDDISSLRSMFERRSTSSLHQPTANNPSLTAALLATQLSPPPSAASSRRTSPSRAGTTSPRRSPHRRIQSDSGPPPIPARKPSIATLTSQPSGDSQYSALTAANLATKTKGPKEAPAPPPPRRVGTSVLPRRTSFSSVSTRTTAADATLAASLAPSRTITPGPRKPPAPAPPPARRRRSLPALPKTLRDPNTKRSPSPTPKPPKTTFPPRNTKQLGEAHKHSWRWVITAQERRRYEGLFAANKDSNGDVINFKVKELWGRSRLEPRVLKAVYELVDRNKRGKLDREEFVVGLWLVDQALKGHKVPERVHEGLWEGVRLPVGLGNGMTEGTPAGSVYNGKETPVLKNETPQRALSRRTSPPQRALSHRFTPPALRAPSFLPERKDGPVNIPVVQKSSPPLPERGRDVLQKTPPLLAKEIPQDYSQVSTNSLSDPKALVSTANPIIPTAPAVPTAPSGPPKLPERSTSSETVRPVLQKSPPPSLPERREVLQKTPPKLPSRNS